MEGLTTVEKLEKVLEENPERVIRTKGEVLQNLAQVIQKESLENDWTPCDKELPECETEVFVKIRCTKGEKASSIVVAAMYEDGTISKCNSIWTWDNDEDDNYLIPEGWWRCRHLDGYDLLNKESSFQVVAWMSLPDEINQLPIKVGDTVSLKVGCECIEGSEIFVCPFVSDCEFDECSNGNERSVSSTVSDIQQKGRDWFFCVKGLNIEIPMSDIGTYVTTL